MKDKPGNHRARWPLGMLGGVLGCSSFAVFILFCALVVAGTMVSRIFNGIQIDPAELAAAMHQAVVVTLQEGETSQRLELIQELEKLGADAVPFVDALVACSGDDEASIRDASLRALRAIDPEAAKRLVPD